MNPLPGIPALRSGACPGCGRHLTSGESRVARDRGEEICVECVMGRERVEEA